jgi:hypothetical protein
MDNWEKKKLLSNNLILINNLLMINRLVEKSKQA